jgi:acetyl-CoA C-acetyltransferase
VSTEIFIVSGARTPIGSFGGSLSGLSPTRLGSVAARAAIERAAVDAADVEQAVFGQVIPTEPTDLYLGRTVAVAAGLPVEAPALTVNRLCGSGVEAVVQAARLIAAGEVELSLAGGSEVLSRSPHALPAMRNGSKLGDSAVQDWLQGTLADPFGHGAMGALCDALGDKYDIPRERQDEYAYASQRKALAAIAAGHFVEQIAPVEVPDRRGIRVFDVDEYPNASTDLEKLAKLRPVFRANGAVTAGNSSGINDGAAAVVLASGAEVARRGLTPMARILSWGHAGVAPELMGIGPVDAVPQALRRAGLTLGDMDIVESNEAFAVQSLAVADLLGLDPERTNPNGGAIALGHPLGATGTIMIVKALYELRRTNKRHALVTMCIGGGQGIAMVLENTAA